MIRIVSLRRRRKRCWVLSEPQKREIVRRRRSGEKLEAIAADFGVGHTAVIYLAKRRASPFVGLFAGLPGKT